ncbi:MAG TPA: hypothetical protein VKX35_07140, partial [Fermentimonas sp.]|nr:hypothetical protein [Fermentimonas sp.]
MRQLLRSIFLLLVLAIFYQCSSVQKTTVATNQLSQIKEIDIAEVVPDTIESDSTKDSASNNDLNNTPQKPAQGSLNQDSLNIVSDSTLLEQELLTAVDDTTFSVPADSVALDSVDLEPET